MVVNSKATRKKSSVRRRATSSQQVSATDEELYLEVAKGNREAFDKIFNRYVNQIYNFIKKQVKDQESAEDITQEVFLRLYKAAKNFDPSKRFSSYLYKIAVNEVRRQYQKSAAEQKYSLNEPIAESEDARERGEVIAVEDAGPEKGLYERLESTRLQSLIDALPPEQRMVVLLKVYQGLTFEEIAKAMDKPLSTVLSRMRYAVQKLRKWMTSEEGELQI